METILDLINLIYDAVANGSCWPAFLEGFLRAVRGNRGSLSLRDSSRDELAMVCWSGWTDADIRLYLQRYAATDPWRLALSERPQGSVSTGSGSMPEKFEESTAFREFYSPRNLIHRMGGTILVTSAGASIITVMRGAEEGPFGESELAILHNVMPHLKRAALLDAEQGSLRAQVATFAGHLDRYPHALLLTDADRRVLYANAAARETAGLNDGLSMAAGEIVLASPADDIAFRRAVRAAASGRNPAVRLEVRRPSHKAPFRLILMPAQAAGMKRLAAPLPAVAVLIVDCDSQCEPDPSVLRELFSLTQAETCIALKLAIGWNLDEIAAETGVAVETVRTHIKRIFSKTGTRRQGELISLILRSAPFRCI